MDTNKQKYQAFVVGYGSIFDLYDTSGYEEKLFRMNPIRKHWENVGVHLRYVMEAYAKKEQEKRRF